MLNVKIKIPQELHSAPGMQEYPPFLSRMIVTPDMLSPTQRELQLKLGKGDDKTPKIVATLYDGQVMNLLYLNLQFYLDVLKCELVAILDVVEFQQSFFLRRIMEENAHKRSQAKTTFSKNFWKMCSNVG